MTNTIIIRSGIETVYISQPVITNISPVSPADSQVLKTTLRAGINISALRCVSKNSDGELEYTNPNDWNSINSIVGVTITSALTGDDVSVIVSGIVRDDFWSWERGKPVFVTENGMLTQSVQNTTYIVKVGWALSEKELFVSINQLLGGL